MSARSLFRHFFKTAAFRALVCGAIASYIRFVYLTSRRRMHVHEDAWPYVRGERNAVFAFWHGRLLMMSMICPKERKMNVLISNHRDGEMIARTMRHFGIGAVRGSSSRGGVGAARRAIAALEAGESVVITPDGPRGPAMRVRPGTLAVARLARVPVVPVTYAATKARRMRSWDRFLVALPFGTIHYAVGAPLMGADPKALETEMTRLTEGVDAL